MADRSDRRGSGSFKFRGETHRFHAGIGTQTDSEAVGVPVFGFPFPSCWDLQPSAETLQTTSHYVQFSPSWTLTSEIHPFLGYLT